MIKLKRLPVPSYLTPAKVAELTSRFKVDGATVWSHAEIKEQLLSSSGSKCAYCETRLEKESKYMEVEHFEDKDNNQDKVVAWNNLLPSCKRCNGQKGTHDVIAEPIINPYDIDPRQHLWLKNYRLKPKSTLGKSTIDALLLNDSDRVVSMRYELGETMEDTIDQAINRYATWQSNGSTRSRNLAKSTVRGILLECQRGSEYAATAATIVHESEDFEGLVSNLKSSGLWDEDLEALHAASKELVFYA